LAWNELIQAAEWWRKDRMPTKDSMTRWTGQGYCRMNWGACESLAKAIDAWIAAGRPMPCQCRDDDQQGDE